MNHDESRELIRNATLLRAEKEYARCIELVLENLPSLDNGLRLNAWIEIFRAAEANGDAEIACVAAHEIARDLPDAPFIQEHL